MSGFEKVPIGKDYWKEQEAFIKNSLNNLKNMINDDPGITKQPRLENGAAVFRYKYMGWDWGIVTRKESNGKYLIRIKKWVRLPNGKEGWKTQKNGNNDTFNFYAKDKNTFNRYLGAALDRTIGKNRDKLPTTGGFVYKLLNSAEKVGKSSEKKPEATEKRNTKFDTQYEKKYGVKLIRDKALNFYVVKKGEGLDIIRQKLSKIPEFSYLASPYYDPKNPKNKTHSFNTPNSSLIEGFYLPIPIRKEQREISVLNFKTKAKKVLNGMKDNKTYGEKIRKLLKNIGENEIINIMAAYARSETAEDYAKFQDPIGSVELHRWEPKYTAYSFSYFHILMEKAADHKTDGPGLRARKNLGLSEGDCYGVENACKLFLGYCFEKSKEFRLSDNFFFRIKSKADANNVAVKYNGDRSYGNKLWANVQHCKTIK